MTDVSANGRYVTSTRWNGHYLIPKGDVTTSDPSPTPTFNAVTPDWVFVTAAGATPSPAPADVIGRYAYAIYDEGGLLDANLVGLPSPSPGPVSTPFSIPYSRTPSPGPSVTYYIGRKGHRRVCRPYGAASDSGGQYTQSNDSKRNRGLAELCDRKRPDKWRIHFP